MTSGSWTPQRAANRLVKLVDVVSTAIGRDRFPININEVAFDAHNIFGWKDPIAQIEAANIAKFEGALIPDDDRKKWLLLYNQSLNSPGRIRFTQAHELGHYILHRSLKESFECSEDDMVNWSKDDKDMEGQADLFASFLLMPLDDYRKQITTAVDLDLLGHCADRYGVSLTAVILKWLQHTPEKAVLVVSNDGFINWASSSDAAMKAGAFFRTRTTTIPLPLGSLAENTAIKHDKKGSNVAARVWFPYAESITPLREMKIYCEQYDVILTLLILPRVAEVWHPRTIMNND